MPTSKLRVAAADAYLHKVFAVVPRRQRVREALTGIGTEAESAGRIINRAERRIAEMRARVAALDELNSQGIITDALASNGSDGIDRKLQKVERDAGVEAQLLRLKAEMHGAGSQANLNREAD